jgi:hypothetical protein
MKTATKDRGAFLHVAGLQGLSPALRGDEPRLVAEKDTASRCGWQPFFEAVERARLALVWDEGDPGATSLVAAGDARALVPRHSLAERLGRARRFLAAWRGKETAR